MNKTGIEWCDYSWNPITGCLRGCWYCYAEKIAKRFPRNFPHGFKPTFHPERLNEPWFIKKPSRIFVGSNSDLFADWIPEDWLEDVMISAWLSPVVHDFLFLTKDPQNIRKDLVYPRYFWLGTTVCNCQSVWRIEHIKKVNCGVRFISFEPLLGKVGSLDLEGIQWIIIGKLTGSRNIVLDPSWVDEVKSQALQLGIPIFMKNNLKPEYPGELIQEFPKVRRE